MPTKIKSKTNRSTGFVVNVPQSVLSKIDKLEKTYPTNTALCKALVIDAPKLRNLRLTKKCLSSTLMSLELSLSKIK